MDAAPKWHGIEDGEKLFHLEGLSLTVWLAIASVAWFCFSALRIMGVARFETGVALAVAKNISLSNLGFLTFVEMLVLFGFLPLLAVWRLLWSVPREVRNSPSGFVWSSLFSVGALLVVLLNPIIMVVFAICYLAYTNFRYRMRTPPVLTVRGEALLLLAGAVMTASWLLILGSVWLPREVIVLRDKPPLDGYVLQMEGDWLPVLTYRDRQVRMIDAAAVLKRTYCTSADGRGPLRARVYEYLIFPSRLPVCEDLLPEPPRSVSAIPPFLLPGGSTNFQGPSLLAFKARTAREPSII